MKKQRIITQKVCSFYVSNMHFVTMILPFIKRQMDKGQNIVTFFENNYTTNIELVLSRLTIKEEDKKKIMEVNWKDTNARKYLEIEKNIKNNLLKNCLNLLIINGSDEYIDIVNKCIERYTEKNNKRIEEDSIKIMDFYEMRKFQ